jgi:hypothetical protein
MLQIRSVFLLALVIFYSVLLAGCAGPAANYAPSIDNVEVLKKTTNTLLKVGVIGVTPGLIGASSISLRGNGMVTPVGSNYGDYVAAALRQELELARLYSPQSGIEITGTLLKNNIDAGGINTNAGQMEARFVVSANSQIRFDKIKRVEHQWESSFAGAVAVPLATNNYPVMVQKLIGSLLSDPDFMNAVRN